MDLDNLYSKFNEVISLHSKTIISWPTSAQAGDTINYSGKSYKVTHNFLGNTKLLLTDNGFAIPEVIKSEDSSILSERIIHERHTSPSLYNPRRGPSFAILYSLVNGDNREFWLRGKSQEVKILEFPKEGQSASCPTGDGGGQDFFLPNPLCDGVSSEIRNALTVGAGPTPTTVSPVIYNLWNSVIPVPANIGSFFVAVNISFGRTFWANGARTVNPYTFNGSASLSLLQTETVNGQTFYKYRHEEQGTHVYSPGNLAVNRRCPVFSFTWTQNNRTTDTNVIRPANIANLSGSFAWILNSPGLSPTNPVFGAQTSGASQGVNGPVGEITDGYLTVNYITIYSTGDPDDGTPVMNNPGSGSSTPFDPSIACQKGTSDRLYEAYTSTSGKQPISAIKYGEETPYSDLFYLKGTTPADAQEVTNPTLPTPESDDWRVGVLTYDAGAETGNGACVDSYAAVEDVRLKGGKVYEIDLDQDINGQTLRSILESGNGGTVKAAYTETPYSENGSCILGTAKSHKIKLKIPSVANTVEGIVLLD